ncbi:RimK domain-containing protein ATP-grasp [Amycolatopsis sp. A133]|uniref:ATP-grasp domain-containing protein n=1 Tax=Amycolatopsis sp. A133 TaxID=3064472 RepID=UPI0027E6F4EE|nr:RimK domain-containing protein ATP-grasp [Amycolatopsis sp. A133]MDQ7802337.1 RimK domain-containing protein ATP-grasp [Amycolatopsis sp. A133]
MTVLLWGLPDESPIDLVATALRARHADVVFVDSRAAAHDTIDLRLDPGAGVGGVLRTRDRTVELARVTGVYLRPVEPELFPGLGPAELARARRFCDALTAFTELTGSSGQCRVANRLLAMGSNISKPYQAQLITRHGFGTPSTLVSSDPAEVLAFAGRHGPLVYKSISGIRSIVTAFDPVADAGRLARLRWCPVQFQERLDGPDVRVHVVGDRVFAAEITTTAIDYRYARREGTTASLRAHDLGPGLAQRCAGLAAALGLPFAGIDLRLVPDGRVVCFEVNPSPGFTWFQHETGQPIATALAAWLTGGRP